MALQIQNTVKHQTGEFNKMKRKLMIPMVAAVMVAMLLLVSGCSKKAPDQPATQQAPQLTTPVVTTPVLQPVQAQEPLPNLTATDQSAQDLNTSELDSMNKDIDKMAVP